MKFEEAKLTSKGQITIPKSIRMQLHLKPGKSVFFIPEEDEVVMVPKEANHLKRLLKLREEIKREDKLITEKEFKQMIKEGKKEWSKVE